jgi:hypothetical protein
VLGEDSEFLSQSLMTHVFWFAHVCAMLLVWKMQRSMPLWCCQMTASDTSWLFLNRFDGSRSHGGSTSLVKSGKMKPGKKWCEYIMPKQGGGHKARLLKRTRGSHILTILDWHCEGDKPKPHFTQATVWSTTCFEASAFNPWFFFVFLNAVLPRHLMNMKVFHW